MNRRLLAELFLFSLLLGTVSGFLSHSAHATNSAVIVAPVVIDTSLKPGSTTTFAVNISNVGPTPETLSAWQLFLKVDPAILKIAQVIEGPALSDIAASLGGSTLFSSRFNATTGLVKTNDLLNIPSSYVDAGLVGGGTLVYVTVRVLAYGTTDLVLNNTKLIYRERGLFQRPVQCPTSSILHSARDSNYRNTSAF